MNLKRFRFHLSTAVVLMLIGAGANWYYVKHYWHAPEPWETRIQKSLEERRAATPGEYELAEAVQVTVDAPLKFSLIVNEDKTTRTLKFENLPTDQILNQVCEKFDAKWTVQQGAVFVCKKSEE